MRPSIIILLLLGISAIILAPEIQEHIKAQSIIDPWASLKPCDPAPPDIATGYSVIAHGIKAWKGEIYTIGRTTLILHVKEPADQTRIHMAVYFEDNPYYDEVDKKDPINDLMWIMDHADIKLYYASMVSFTHEGKAKVIVVPYSGWLPWILVGVTGYGTSYGGLCPVNPPPSTSTSTTTVMATTTPSTTTSVNTSTANGSETVTTTTTPSGSASRESGIWAWLESLINWFNSLFKF